MIGSSIPYFAKTFLGRCDMIMNKRITLELSLEDVSLLHSATEALLDQFVMSGGAEADAVIALQDRLWSVLKENGDEINFVNLTPSDIIMFGDKNTLIPSSGGINDAQNLPEPRERTWFVVLPEVANAAKGRRDLLIPDPNHAVRDESGNILGYRALAIV
jgi:hypothetical protein